MINFAYPYAFLLLFLPFIIYWLLPTVKGMQGDALRIPFLDDLERISISSGGIWKPNYSRNPNISKSFLWTYLLWFLLCLSAARPQIVGEPLRLQNFSRDIMLVLDISTSMLEPDFSFANRRISRLDAVKKVVSDFTSKRANDRIGLILFGTRAYLQAPLTYDKASVKDILWSMQAGMAGDSTSIGDALGLALKNLKDKTGDKVIILLTDGENNDGSLSLAQVIKLAKEKKKKTYTIGVGSPNVFFQMLSIVPQGIDDTGLKELAQQTKGQYFRAESTSDLQQIYNLIDKLEPTQGDENYIRETKDIFYIPLIIAILWGLILAFIIKRAV